MKIFVTGASGYIGGSVAAALMGAGHEVLGLVRSQDRADQVRALGMQPILGSLDDGEVLQATARQVDAVVNAANAEHEAAAAALLAAMAGSGKPFIQTSGSSIVADLAMGEARDPIYDEDTPVEPLPGRAGRVALNNRVRDAAKTDVRTIVVCPTLIYGRGRGVNPNSIQVPWLVALAKKRNGACHIGPGENIWANVHIDDLVDLYLLALTGAPAGSFYYAENGENSMREVCQAINDALGYPQPPQSVTIEEAAAEWGDGAANYTMGSNSRVRAVRARKELGWTPHRRPLLEEIRETSR